MKFFESDVSMIVPPFKVRSHLYTWILLSPNIPADDLVARDQLS